jgi:uncharacterized lipoprotein YajG
MRSLLLVAVLLLSGCATTKRTDELQASINAHTAAISAVVEYIAAAQEAGDLPKVEELKNKLGVKIPSLKETATISKSKDTSLRAK